MNQKKGALLRPFRSLQPGSEIAAPGEQRLLGDTVHTRVAIHHLGNAEVDADRQTQWPRASASTTDVSTCRSGIDQYFLSKRFFSSPLIIAKPCFS